MTEHEFTDENQAEFNKQMVKALQALRGAGEALPQEETLYHGSLLNKAREAVKALREKYEGIPF